MLTIATWNVNGIRAAVRNGFLNWLRDEQPDIACVQEIKACEADLGADIRMPDGYASVLQPAKRKGYSGVATFFRKGLEPKDTFLLGIPEFDDEGRVLCFEYPAFTLINAYFPNSQPEKARIEYKIAFCRAITDFSKKLQKKGRHVVMCGDFNIAPTEIDLARPKENENSAGYYPEERAVMSEMLAAGHIDTFRHFHPEPGHYTWWSYRSQARTKNIGWRIDYHLADKAFADRLAGADIRPQVMGSDHCPVVLSIKD